MTFEIFTILAFLIAIVTAFATEGIKKWLTEKKITYAANALAGEVAVALSIVISIGYMILVEAAFNAKMAVILIALAFVSWLGAMIGYDKVKQLFEQFRQVKDKFKKVKI